MTTAQRDFWRCPSRELHRWRYLGNNFYICERCGFSTTKAELKLNTEPQVRPTTPPLPT